MSEGFGRETASGPDGNEAAAAGPTAGALLRQAREAAGLHVAALAVALKVPVRKVEALEADRYDLLTDAVFVRALASSICRSLKLDPQPVLERLPRMAAPRLIGSSRSINEPFRAPSDGAPPTWLDQLSRPVFLAVFALLLGALVLVLLPKAQQADAAATVASVTTPAPSMPPAQPTASVPAAPDAATAVVSPAVAAVAVAPASPAVAAAAVAPSTAAASAARQPASSPAAAASQAGPAKPVAEAPAAPASGVIVFRAKAESWVEVIDAKDIVAVRKVLEAGESAAASGALPLRVTIGRVDATQVQVRGKPFDLRNVSRDNVARFEIK
jgi:cytoskeleton protein RodZ